jgi:hypothetical protein
VAALCQPDHQVLGTLKQRHLEGEVAQADNIKRHGGAALRG